MKILSTAMATLLVAGVTGGIVFAVRMNGRMAVLESNAEMKARIAVIESKLATLGDFLRMEGRMDLVRGPRPLAERNSPMAVIDIVRLQAEYRIDVRAEPKFWTVFRRLYLTPHERLSDIFDLMAWLRNQLGEDTFMERALKYKRTAIGYAEFWGLCREEALEDLAAFLSKFGLTVDEFHRLADAGEGTV